jgi:hypothetical protein
VAEQEADAHASESAAPRAKSLANLKPWPRGVSGNPLGRPKIEPRVRRYARRFSRQMVNVLRKIALDEKESTEQRRRAAVQLIEIADGKHPTSQTIVSPLSATQVNVSVGNVGAMNPVDATIELATCNDMPEERRQALVNRVFENADRAAARVAERQRLAAPIEAEAQEHGQ